MSHSKSGPLRVGVAVVEHRQCYLVGYRGSRSTFAGHAEFPGGKCHTEESSAECAVRECFEETGLRVQITELLSEQDHAGPHGLLRISFFLAKPVDAATVENEHANFKWAPLETLKELTFPPANAGVVDKLIARRESHPWSTENHLANKG